MPFCSLTRRTPRNSDLKCDIIWSRNIHRQQPERKETYIAVTSVGYKTDFNFSNIIATLTYYFFCKKFTSKSHQSVDCYFKPCKEKERKNWHDSWLLVTRGWLGLALGSWNVTTRAKQIECFRLLVCRSRWMAVTLHSYETEIWKKTERLYFRFYIKAKKIYFNFCVHLSKQCIEWFSEFRVIKLKFSDKFQVSPACKIKKFTFSLWLNVRQSEIFTEFPLKDSFKLLDAGSWCFFSNVERFQKLCALARWRNNRACACYIIGIQLTSRYLIPHNQFWFATGHKRFFFPSRETPES